MNGIHIISGTVIATISLLVVTSATMSDQQSVFAHKGYYYYGHYHNIHNHDSCSAAAADAAGSDD
jgi:hypothetical protein